MKNQIIIIAAAFVVVALLSFSQDDKKGIGNVRKVMGREVYIMSEPALEYEVVGNVSGYSMVKSCSIQNIVELLLKKAEKGDTKFDALLFDGGGSAQLIVFKKKG